MNIELMRQSQMRCKSCIVYEILNTEDEKKFKKKIRRYPVGVRIVKVQIVD